MFVGDDPAARRALAETWFDEAIGELQAGEINAARGRLIDAVELSPEYAEARNALGILLMTEGRHSDAELQFDWAIRADPDVAQYHYHIALAYFAQGGIGFATPALNRALELDPEFVEAKRMLLDAYLNLGRWERARKLHDELTEEFGTDDPVLLYQDALLTFAEERTADAETLLQKAAKRMPNDPAPVVTLGVLYETLGYFDRAERAYKQALKAAPKHAYIHLVLADLYQRTGRYRLAENHLRSTLGQATIRRMLADEEVARSYFQLGEVNYQLGKYRVSQLYRKRGVAMLPELKETKISIDTAAHFALGLVELERKNVDVAIREFKRALKGNRDFILAWVRLADALMLKAELSPIEERETLLKQASKAAEQAQELDPRFALGYYVEGRAQMAMADLQEGAFRDGTLRESLFAFQKAKFAEHPPEDISIYQSAILSELNSYADAASTLNEAEQKLKPRFELSFLRAAELIKAKEYKDARAALSKAYALDQSQPDLGVAMSYVLFQLGDVDGAISALSWSPGKDPLPGLVDDVVDAHGRGAATASSPTTDSTDNVR